MVPVVCVHCLMRSVYIPSNWQFTLYVVLYYNSVGLSIYTCVCCTCYYTIALMVAVVGCIELHPFSTWHDRAQGVAVAGEATPDVWSAWRVLLIGPSNWPG